MRRDRSDFEMQSPDEPKPAYWGVTEKAREMERNKRLRVEGEAWKEVHAELRRVIAYSDRWAMLRYTYKGMTRCRWGWFTGLIWKREFDKYLEEDHVQEKMRNKCELKRGVEGWYLYDEPSRLSFAEREVIDRMKDIWPVCRSEVSLMRGVISGPQIDA